MAVPFEQTNSDNLPMKTEAEFLAQVEQVRSALQLFSANKDFPNPSTVIMKAAMDQVMKAIVSLLQSFSVFRRLETFFLASLQRIHQVFGPPALS